MSSKSRSILDAEIQQLKDNLLKMASLVDQAVDKAMPSLVGRVLFMVTGRSVESIDDLDGRLYLSFDENE